MARELKPEEVCPVHHMKYCCGRREETWADVGPELLKWAKEAAEQIAAFGNESGGIYPVLSPLMDAISRAERVGGR